MGVTFTLLLFLFMLMLLLAVFHYASKGRKYWKIRNVPYREPCPLFGNFGPTFTMKRSYVKMLEFFYNRYKGEKYVGLFQARRPTLMVIDLDIVKNVLSKDFSHFSDRISVATDTQREPLLRNLSNMSGDEWRAMRHIVTPTFSSAKLKAMFPLIASCAKTLKSTLLEQSLNEVDVPSIITRYSTDVIGSCAFGFDPGSLKNPESPFLKMSRKMFATSRSAVLKRYCRTFFPRLFKLFNFKTYSPDVEAFITSTIKQVLEERRSSGIERHDFIHSLLNVPKVENGFAMTDELITSNSFIFMLAGLESSSLTMSFCLYQLAKDSELQERIRTEVMECMEAHKGLCYEAVTSMYLCNKTVLETLRLHPITPLTTRLCTSPCILSGTDLSMKQKQPVLIPIYCIQRDPDIFPDPDKFDPDRFEKDSNLPGFLAFGDGPRSCPGARFAQLSLVAGLAAILSSFSVEPCSRTTLRIEYDPRSVLLKNKGGIWLRFTRIG